MATGGNGVINYGFSDEVPFAGNNYYRLKVLDLDATFSFTRIVKVAIGEGASASKLNPNPVTGKVVNLELLNRLAFHLLPETFTMKEVQELYETILETSFAANNFPKRVLELNALERLEKRFTGAANKAPYLYRLAKQDNSY